MELEKQYCDPETGECTPSPLGKGSAKIKFEAGKEIIYVGDPMCSWCWGISPHLQSLKKHFPQYKFSIVVGGLRPGGGDPWDENMKSFLMHHWQEVTERSGQPFGYQLFDKEHFHYDTEPPCRAVVAARQWVGARELDFYEAVSRKFYVDNEDPNEPEFYRSICEEFSISFEDFLAIFNDEKTKYATNQEFQLNRQWGVTGYPTVLFKTNEKLFQINRGYSEFEEMKMVIEKILSEETVSA